LKSYLLHSLCDIKIPLTHITAITDVTCGSVIKLRHTPTGVRLHSHQVTYGSGSGQQSVTGYANGDDPNSLWLVAGPVDKRCPTG
jgi:dolichyl-phosphate-mannose--protein O-mannosyl transferase